MLNLTGLWVNESKDGKRYMAGNLGGVRILVFKNQHKRKDNDPDYTLCLAERERKNDNAPADEKDSDVPF